jgi:hypothetical protein
MHDVLVVFFGITGFLAFLRWALPYAAEALVGFIDAVGRSVARVRRAARTAWDKIRDS